MRTSETLAHHGVVSCSCDHSRTMVELDLWTTWHGTCPMFFFEKNYILITICDEGEGLLGQRRSNTLLPHTDVPPCPISLKITTRRRVSPFLHVCCLWHPHMRPHYCSIWHWDECSPPPLSSPWIWCQLFASIFTAGQGLSLLHLCSPWFWWKEEDTLLTPSFISMSPKGGGLFPPPSPSPRFWH